MITKTGFICLCLGIYLLVYPSSEQYDLIASVIGLALVVSLAAAFLLALVNKLQLPKTARATIEPERLIPGYEFSSSLSMPDLVVLPLVQVSLERVFKQEGVTSERILLVGGKGFDLRERFLTRHRGYWESSEILLKVSDSLGFFEFRHKVHSELQFKVYPRAVEAPYVNLSPSVYQAGDLSFPNAPRAGELFDMKSYEKSDGIKRILWKVFARSRQLFVKIPEQAIYPESEILVYLVAGQDEDDVAASCWSYISQLGARNIRVIFGTDLAPGIYGGTELKQNESSLKRIEDMIVCSGTSSAAGTGLFLNKFKTGEVVVFCSEASEEIRSIAGADAHYVEVANA